MQTKFKTEYSTIIKAARKKVWKAITDPSMVKQYFFGTDLETDWKVGNPIYFRGAFEGTAYEDKGTILEYHPMTKISYSYLSSWSGKEDHPDNYLIIKYLVEELEQGTRLTITQTNYDQERADHSKENWKMVIDGMKNLIE